MKLSKFLELSEAWDPKDYAASKSDVKKLENKCNKAVKLLQEIAKDYKKMHGGAPVGHDVLWNTYKDFEDVARHAATKFGGWFGYLKHDDDYIKQEIEMSSKELYVQIKEQWNIFDENHHKFSEKGVKAAAGRARKAIGEIKKLVTEYRKASVAECK